MPETEQSTLPDIYSGLAGLPAPIKTSFFKALSDLVGGLTAIPAAKLRQIAQSIDDVTVGRSAVAASMAAKVAKVSGDDALILQAAAEIYTPVSLRRAKNRLNVADKAAEHLGTDDKDSSNPKPPEEDWMHLFARFAEDASSERLQDLFGRILAGEIRRPGSFGMATLRAVSELDRSIAEDFSFAWSKNTGKEVDYSKEWQRGELFSRWKRLSEAGLMAENNIVQFLPAFQPILNGHCAWAPMQSEDAWLHVTFRQESTVCWPNIPFTKIGRELGRILPKPDYIGNIKEAALRLPKHGLVKMELLIPGLAPQQIWQTDPIPTQ